VVVLLLAARMSIHPAPNVVVAQRFRLNRLLGKGGMGSVWHATHLGLDVPCAVKFIEGEGAQLAEVQSRFEREAKAAAQLRSPHVVQILDHGVCDGTPYIAMELLDGEDLGKRLARCGRLPPRELLAIVTQVCRALTKAHGVGIVHRDLKPDNIFIVHDDDREIAKVLDFGIAKATGASATGSSTRTGAMLGTPYYMSPEQAQGIKAVDARSDLWSLAVIVFEALTGRRPFESEALGDLLMKIIVAPLPFPSQVAHDLPPGLDGWWAKASQRDPAQRYQSAKDLCDALAAVLGRSAGETGDSVGVLAMGPRSPMLTPAHGQTPQPFPGASTGAPIARTFAGKPPGVKSRGAVVGVVAGGFVVLAAGVVGMSFAVRGKGNVPVTAAAPNVDPTPNRMSVADAMVAEPHVTTTAIAAAPAETLSSASVAAVSPTPVAKPMPLSKPPALANPQAVRPPQVVNVPLNAPPPAKPPVTTEKKKPVDLGI
jgi:hypothetical protein